MAVSYAEGCTFAHNGARHLQSSEYTFVGENLAATSGAADYVGLVQRWYDEESDYTYSNNQCDPGKVCGHYTQVCTYM